MSRVIGICGHRGAGKTSVGWLLGNCLEMLCTNRTYTEQDYNRWVDKVMESGDIHRYSSMRMVCWPEFQDQILFPVSMLTGISMDKLYDRKFCEEHIIDLNTFRVLPEEEAVNSKLTIYDPETLEECFRTSDMLWEKPSGIYEDMAMSIKDFIIYYGKTIMPRFFGTNVWINALRTSFQNVVPNTFQIYVDTKTRAEMDYIKEGNGILINVERKSNHKERTIEEHCKNPDFTIRVNGDLKTTYDQIDSIAKQIFHGNNN